MKFHEKRQRYRPIKLLIRRARYCDGNFLLAETEVVMTTLIDIFTCES